MLKVAVYTREHMANAWKFEYTTNLETAKLYAEVNKGFGVDTLLVPATLDLTVKLPTFLDSYHVQSDFPTLKVS